MFRVKELSVRTDEYLAAVKHAGSEYAMTGVISEETNAILRMFLYPTRIDTPFAVWSAISRGEIGGAEALGKQMYTVSGDFSLMIEWDKFFGSTSTVKEAEKRPQNTIVQKTPSMMTMLIPWITF